MSKSYQAKIESDPENEENYLLVLPDDFIQDTGWKEGDEIEVDIVDGKLTIKKKS